MAFIVTVTERGTFRRCRRMWDYSSRSRQNLEPIMPRPAFALGKLVHQTLAEWMITEQALDREVSPEELYQQFAEQELAHIMQQYRKTVGANISPSEFEQFEEVARLGGAMIHNYKEKYETPLPEGWSLIAPEQKVLLPVPVPVPVSAWNVEKFITNPEGQLLVWVEETQTWEPCFLEAQFDGLIRRDADGLIFVLEHKTYEQRPREDSLQMNDQFLAYVWAASQLDLGPVVGIAYDGLWKRAQPPRGRTFDDLFCRVIQLRPQHELAEFENNLRMEFLDMANPQIYPNRPWLGCFDCSFEKLCSAQSRGEDWQYVRAKSFKQRESDVELEEVEA